MSEKPFTEFLKKTKDRDFSKRVYDEVIDVFTRHGLNERQARAFLWGSTEEIQELINKEQPPGDQPSPFSYGPPRPGPWPMGTTGGEGGHS